MSHSSHDSVGASSGHGMTPWFHFALSGSLFFSSWKPTSKGALAGACIGIFLLAVLERWVHAMRTVLHHRWHVRALAATKESKRTLPPFMLANDLPRGALFAVQSLLGYLLMLAVMTFQAGYFISVVVGAGVGEVLFGRMGAKH